MTLRKERKRQGKIKTSLLTLTPVTMTQLSNSNTFYLEKPIGLAVYKSHFWEASQSDTEAPALSCRSFGTQKLNK